MLLLAALALCGVLLYRLSLLRPYLERRDHAAWDAWVTALGEDILWHEQMHRLACRRPELHGLPRLMLR